MSEAVLGAVLSFAPSCYVNRCRDLLEFRALTLPSSPCHKEQCLPMEEHLGRLQIGGDQEGVFNYLYDCVHVCAHACVLVFYIEVHM